MSELDEIDKALGAAWAHVTHAGDAPRLAEQLEAAIVTLDDMKARGVEGYAEHGRFRSLGDVDVYYKRPHGFEGNRVLLIPEPTEEG